MGDDEDQHAQLRARAIEFMKSNQGIFTDYFSEDSEPFDTYIQRMAKVGAWAEETIIQATGLVLNVTIDIIQLRKNAKCIETEGRFTATEVTDANNGERIGRILLLRVNNNHYHVGSPLEQSILEELPEQSSCVANT
jgi:hypothetical protein